MSKWKKIILKNNISIGILFSVSSFLLSYTIVIPIVTILIPVLISETISGIFISEITNKNIALFSILFYSIISLIIFLFSIYKRAKNSIENKPFNILWIFFVQFFIFHAIGFYIYWGKTMNYRGDGQLMFLSFDSFKYSSFAFIPFGILLEISKIIPLNLFIKKIQNNKKELSLLNVKETKNRLLKQYQTFSNQELQNIINEDDWTIEAKQVAKSILSNRNS